MKALILIFFMIFSRISYGYETDQFTTPNGPLADIGDDITAYMMKGIHSAIDEVNHKEVLRERLRKLEEESRIQEQQNIDGMQFSTTPLQKEIKELKSKLELMDSIPGIVKLITKKIGEPITWQEQLDGVFGLPYSIYSFKKNVKNNLPVTYTASRFNTIYSYSGLQRGIPTSYMMFASTMHAFDLYFGSDKLGHMLNQGYQYYEKYQQALAENQSKEAALKKIVDYGIKSENQWFGLLVDGVYSNGDLSANIAGFHLYKNLFEEIELNETKYAPLLIVQVDGTIVFNPEYDNNEKAFVSKFFTLHLNEAFNPSHIEALQRPYVKKAIKDRCEKFLNFYHIEDREALKKTIDSMKLWNNISYGHNDEDLLRVDEICYLVDP